MTDEVCTQQGIIILYQDIIVPPILKNDPNNSRPPLLKKMPPRGRFFSREVRYFFLNPQCPQTPGEESCLTPNKLQSRGNRHPAHRMPADVLHAYVCGVLILTARINLPSICVRGMQPPTQTWRFLKNVLGSWGMHGSTV